MDPTLSGGAMLGGTALSMLGGYLDRQEKLAAAQREAEARNASLAKNVGILQGFGADNRSAFDSNMTGYAQPAQEQRLADAQTKRGDAVAGNISAPNLDQPIQQDASPATRSDLAKRMLAVHDASTSRAKAMGRLGGYSDTWLQNNLGNAQAGRDIGVNNNFAEGRKALIGPESDLAAAVAYKPPSIWSTLLKGAGSAMSSAGGAGFGGGGGFAGAGSLPTSNPAAYVGPVGQTGIVGPVWGR